MLFFCPKRLFLFSKVVCDKFILGFVLFFEGNVETASNYFDNAEISSPSDQSLTAKLGKVNLEITFNSIYDVYIGNNRIL